MKVLFLDIDGVANSDQWFKSPEWKLAVKKYGDDRSDFDPVLVARLNEIVEHTGCYIVISSAWRLTFTLERIKGFLIAAGFDHPERIIDKTPSLMYKKYSANKTYNEVNPRVEGRGSEIDAWLREHEDVESFVILDDNSDMKPHMDRLVKTSLRTGIKDIDVQKTIQMLNE